MHRTDAEGHVGNQFHPGNPAAGQKATRIGAKFLNTVQEELAHAIEEAGFALDDADNTQLYAAIVAIATGVYGAGGGGGGGGGSTEGVPTDRRVDTAGLATGGGDLVANRTITVPKATVAAAAAQARDDVAVTPAGLAGLVGASASGSTLIITLGTVRAMIFAATAQANATTVVSLPQSFSQACYAAFCNSGQIDNDAQDNGPFVSGKGLTSVSLYNARNSALPAQILAIGV